MSMLDDIRTRLSVVFEADKLNPYMLWVDCQCLLREVDFLNKQIKELEYQAELDTYRIAGEY